MPTRAQLESEAYRRGIMPQERLAVYEEAVRRGIVKDEFARGKLTSRSPTGKVAASMSTVYESIPGADEVVAGLDTAGRMLRGQKFGDAWKGARDNQAGMQAGLRQDNPKTSNLMTGVGYAAQAAPMFLSGGATAAPQAAPKVANLFQKGRNAATWVGRQGATGAAYAAANAGAGRGGGMERLKAASDATVPGFVAGVAAPLIIGAPGAIARGPVGRNIARTANRAASAFNGGKGFIDPNVEAFRRVGEKLRADGFTADEIQGALQEWNRVGGPSPAFMDLISRGGRGQQTLALFRGAALTGGGRTEAARYGKAVATDLTGNAQNRTSRLTPDQRTVPMMEANINQRITANSQPPQVQPSSGGQAVSERLNTEFNAARTGVRSSFAAARGRGEGVTLPDAERFTVQSRLKEALGQDGFTPRNASGVYAEIDALRDPGSASIKTLFDTRQALNAISRGNDATAATAAGRAKNALDDYIDEALQRGLFKGDEEAVSLARAAVAERRAMGERFQRGDAVQRLTERDPRRGGANRVAPESASTSLLGNAGQSGTNFVPNMNTTRDLTRLRDTLGPDSPEWNQLRQEARARLLGQDAGTERFGQAYARFEQNNPELARLLTTPQERAALARNRANITAAVGSRQSLTTGQAVTTQPPDAYQAQMGSDRATLQTAATRQLENEIGRSKEGGTGVLNTISGQSNTGRNLANTFGDEAAADYRQSIGQMVDQMNNARFINPNSNSQSVGRLFDADLVDVPTPPKGWLNVVLSMVNAVKRGASITEAEREALVRIATTKVQGQEAVAARRALASLPPPRATDRTSNLFAIPATRQENSR